MPGCIMTASISTYIIVFWKMMLNGKNFAPCHWPGRVNEVVGVNDFISMQSGIGVTVVNYLFHDVFTPLTRNTFSIQYNNTNLEFG